MSPSQIKMLPYMPLEMAAMTGNESLVDILLEFEASASICFAVHLAAIKGHLSILQKLLPYWKEGRWKPYIKGLKEDPNELVRVCTLESGLVQAVCASQKPSLELLDCIKEDEKGVYSCKKILTHHMVNQLRPDICSVSSPTLMNRVLYKHSEDMRGSDEHICQKLFLTNLLMCQQKSLSVSQIDELGSYLVENKCYLGEIRVSKKSTIHVVCESFITAVRRRMWKTVESILIKGGNTLWTCLLVNHHTCHKFSYAEWIEDSAIPCLSTTGMWKMIHGLPLNLLEIFLEIGKRVMNKHDMKAIRDKIVTDNKNRTEKEEESENTMIRTEKENPEQATVTAKQTTSETAASNKLSNVTSRPEMMLRDVIMYHINIMLKKEFKGRLIMLSKLTTLLPDLFLITLETFRFSHFRHEWFTAAGIDVALKSVYYKGLRTSRLIRNLRNERLEIRLWTLINNLSLNDILAFKERNMTLLHVTCLQNDYRLTSSCLSVVTPLSPNLPDNCGVTPMDIAASRANIKILDLLKQKGGTCGASVLVAACVGKGFMGE